MLRGNTRAKAARGEMIGRLGRCRVGNPVALLAWGAACFAAIASGLPASAQVLDIGNPGSQVSVSNAITSTNGNTGPSTTTLSGTLSGSNSAGYFVASGGELIVNNGLMENFTTSGGSGSGGGLGAGGAIFIDTGGSVILNGTSFLDDTAVGGTGGTSSPYGGTLNNIQAVTAPDASPNGANGVNGTANPDNTAMYGPVAAGNGNGLAGLGVTNGANATNGYGGIGGVGGPGGDGWTYNPVAESNNDIAIANVSATAEVEGALAAQIIEDVGSAAAQAAAAANPFEDPLSPISATAWALKAINDGLNLTGATTTLVTAILTQQITQGTLDDWTADYNAGLNGNGGPGENGGNGGNGSYGFGGGAGGQGGAYGLTENPAGTDGTGGNGGAGGAGGFGGGGGAGGYGFGANQNGCGGSTIGPSLNNPSSSPGCTSTSGAGGAGGAAGFGAGVGSTGGATGISNATGGGGGDAYGGAIFVNTGASLTITGDSTFSGDSAIGGASLNNGLAGGGAGTDLFMMQGSTVILAPGAGNVVTFNGTIADNSTASIGAPTVAQTAGYPVSGGAYLTIYSGTTVFNGANTYSGQTVINGGALGGPLNTGTNTSGAPNYALTDGALQAAVGVGLPSTSNLNFSGPGQFTGGVLQIPGTVLSGGIVEPTTFDLSLNPSVNPDGGGDPGGVQWTGSGGFAAINAPLTVTLNAGASLTWGVDGFVPVGYSLIFGSADSNASVTFTNAIDIGTGTVAAGTAASILVGNNGNAAGSTAIMSGVLSGSGDLSIGGGGFNGTLVLSAANTYTGATVVNSGTLAFSGAGSIADSSGLTIADTGGVDISGTTSGATIPTLTGSGTVNLGGQELTVADGGTFSGVIADGGASGGTKGSLIIAAGTETLSGTNTYTGDTTIDLGATLALTGTGSIASSTPVLDNGIFDISQTALGAAITSLSGSGQALIGSNLLVITDGSTTFSGDINDGGLGGGSGGSLIVAGGTQTLSGINTYTGATIVDAGATLALLGSGSIATSSVVDAIGTFDISQTSAGASIATLMGTGNVALGNQELTVTDASTTFAGVIADGGIGSGTKGSLIVGSGTETLTGTNTYTGTTTTDPGATLALAGTGSIADSSDVIDNGTFDISQTTLGAAITTLSGSGHVALGAQLLLITNGSTTFSGVIADGGIGGGAGGMLAVSGGTQTLSGDNTYTGGTLIESGATLALTGTGSIADSAYVFDNGIFDISQTSAGASIITLLGAGNVALGDQELTITDGSTTFAGVIADGGIGSGTEGSLIVGAGTETLTGTNTYTGTTTTDPGATLALAGTGSIATSSDVIDNGTFDISQTTSGASIITLSGSGSGTAALGSQTLTITNGSTTFSGAIADGGIVDGAGGNLTVSGGTQTLAGVNTYTGLTTIAPATGTATLALTGIGSIATSSEVLVAANGTFDISGTSAGASIMTLSGSGGVTLGSQVLTITAGAAGSNGANPAGIFSGIIGGLGGMAVTGGHEELTGVNTYTGGTTVTGGAILSINNSNSLGASSSLLTINNGTLVVDASITIPQPITLLNAPPGTDEINLNSNSVTLSGALNGPGVLTAINGGTLNLTGTVGTVSGLGGIVLGPGTTLTTSTSASAGLGTTPIVVVPTSGSPSDVFTGSVHVVGPLDIVNGATPELIILPGDTLAGVGGVNIMTVVQGGGANAPGDGPGTIVVNAPVIDLSGSTYTVQIDGPLNSYSNCSNIGGCAGQYSSTIVTGTGNTYTAAGTLAPQLTGISAPANNTYIPPVTTSFIIVQAEGGVVGSFSGLTQPAPGVTGSSGGLAPGTRLDILYYNTGSTTPIGNNAASSPNGRTASQYSGNPNAIALWVTPASYTNLSSFGVALSQNQSNLGSALNALRGPAGVSNNAQATWDFGYLFAQQPQNLPADFDTLTGEVNADAAEGAFQLTDQFLELMLDPFARPVSSDSNAGAGAGHSAAGFAAVNPPPGMPLDIASAEASAVPPSRPATFEQRWMAWGAGMGGYSSISGDPATAGTHNFSTSTYGFAAGMENTSIPGTRFGFAVAGGGGNWAVTQENLGTGNNYNAQAGVYGRANLGPAYFGAAFSVANNWMQTSRTAFGGDHLTASFDAQTFGARAEAGYGFVYGRMKFTPFAAGQVLAFRSPDYAETDTSGGGFALNYAAQTETDLSSQLGGRLDAVARIGDMPLIVQTRAAWQHDWVNNADLAATFQAGLAPGAPPGAGTSFVVNGAALPQNSAVVTAGTDLYVTPAISISSKLSGQIAPGAQTYGGSLTLRDAW